MKRLGLLTALFLSSCGLFDPPPPADLWIYNDSDTEIGYFFPSDGYNDYPVEEYPYKMYPDTTMAYAWWFLEGPVPPGGCHEFENGLVNDIYLFRESDTLSLYIFDSYYLNSEVWVPGEDGGHFENPAWDDAILNYKIMARYDLSHEDMNHLRDDDGLVRVHYPPTPEMKDIKMYPGYEQLTGNKKLCQMNVVFKLILAAAIFAATGLASSAQVGIQARVTVPYQEMTRHNPFNRYGRYGMGVNLGLDYEIRIVKGFRVTPGLHYNLAHTEAIVVKEGYTIDEWQTDHLINIPIHLKYVFNIKPDKFALYLYAGPALSLGTVSQTRVNVSNSFDIYFDNYTGIIKDMDFRNPDTDADKELDIMDKIQPKMDSLGLTQRRFDLQIDCGAGFRFNGHWELLFGYTFGVIDRFNRDYGDNHDMKAAQGYIGFGYRF